MLNPALDRRWASTYIPFTRWGFSRYACMGETTLYRHLFPFHAWKENPPLSTEALTSNVNLLSFFSEDNSEKRFSTGSLSPKQRQIQGCPGIWKLWVEGIFYFYSTGWGVYTCVFYFCSIEQGVYAWEGTSIHAGQLRREEAPAQVT